MQRRRRLWINTGQVVGAFALQVASIVLLWRQNGLLCAVMLADSLAALELSHESADAICFLSVRVIGSLAKVLPVCSGVWPYADPTLLGIPAWFPVAQGPFACLGAALSIVHN